MRKPIVLTAFDWQVFRALLEIDATEFERIGASAIGRRIWGPGFSRTKNWQDYGRLHLALGHLARAGYLNKTAVQRGLAPRAHAVRYRYEVTDMGLEAAQLEP